MLCTGPSCRGLVPSAAGVTTLTGTFYGVSAALVVTVSPASAAVTSLSIAAFGTSATLVGLAGTSAVLAVTATFDDGTNLVVALTGAASSAWITPSSL